MSFSPRKRHSDEAPSTSAPASGSASSASESSQVTQRQFPTNLQSEQSQSDLQPPQENQQSQPVYPWSVHGLPFGQSPSPFLRYAHAHSTNATVTGELFLFGGCSHRPRSPSNDLYVFSTRDFSTTLLKTSGDIPSPRFAHCAVLTSTTLLIWGGRTVVSKQNAQNRSDDDSFYLLNLSTSDLFDVKTRFS
jgi:Galactose oxidase, central domain